MDKVFKNAPQTIKITGNIFDRLVNLDSSNKICSRRSAICFLLCGLGFSSVIITPINDVMVDLKGYS